MKHITKRQRPHEHFLKYVEDKKASERHFYGLSNEEKSQKARTLYDDFRISGIQSLVKKELVDDQGFICCYCQKRINTDKMTQIEHLNGRKLFPEQVLEFSNLLASCDGGSKQREDINKFNSTAEKYPLYCDQNKKGYEELLIHPLHKDCADFFDYKCAFLINYADKTIPVEGFDESAKLSIKILNLDNWILQEERYNAVMRHILINPLDDSLKEDYSNIKSKEELQEVLELLYDKSTSTYRKHNNKFEPYCQVIVKTIEFLITFL